MDMSVDPASIHSDGEYYGYNTILSRVQLMRLMASLDSAKTTQATEAYASAFSGLSSTSVDGMTYYTPRSAASLALATVA